MGKKIERIKDSPQIPMVLVGNKCDLEDQRVVLKSEGEQLAEQYKCPFFETSAKDHVNVDDVSGNLCAKLGDLNKLKKILLAAEQLVLRLPLINPSLRRDC